MSSVPVSQKAVILNEDGQLLTMRRSKTAPVRPLTWDLPGGDLEHGEDPFASIKREIKEETGLDAITVFPYDVEAHINDNVDYWVTIAYKVQASGDVQLSFEHDQYRWVTPDEFLKLESAPKLQRFVNNLKR